MSEDYFADMRGQLNNSYGSLGGEGADEMDQVVVKPLDRAGVHYAARCHFCGQKNQIDLTWPEIAYVAQGQQPEQWVYDAARGAMRPNIGCCKCHVVMMFLVTPDECMRHLHAGEAAGYLQPGYVNALRQRLQQASAGYRR